MITMTSATALTLEHEMTKESSLHFAQGAEGTLDFERYGDEIHIAIDAPWAGSTEGGFGENLGATLSKQDALRVAAWIMETFGG
jgi:hypothetical protein